MADEAEKNKSEKDEVELDEAELDEGEVKEKKPLSTAMIVILAVVFASLVSGGIVGVTMILMGDDGSEQVAVTENQEGEDEEAEEVEAEEEEVAVNEGPVQYHGLDPKFVVSFHDQRIARFMQFSLQIMTRDDEVIKQIQQHNPAIRSSLLLLFDSQDAEVMKTREGKEQLLALITEDMNRMLEELADVSGVEAAYFESFLIQ